MNPLESIVRAPTFTLADSVFCQKTIDFRLVKFYAFPLNYGGGAVA
jgi:hypothetical protein